MTVDELIESLKEVNQLNPDTKVLLPDGQELGGWAMSPEHGLILRPKGW